MEKGLIVHVAIINKDELLILKRAKEAYLGGLWDIPGGTLKGGELPEKGAVREVFEETALKLRNIHLFYCYSVVDQKKNKQFITLVFLGKADKKNIKINPKEHSEYSWIKLDEIKSYQTVDYLYSCVISIKEKGLIRLIS